MNISQVITELEKYKEKEGELPVYCFRVGFEEGMEGEINEDSFGVMDPEYTENKMLIHPKRLTLDG